MRAKLLDLPTVVTGQERAEDFCDRLEQLLLEAGEVFPRADLRRRAAACMRGLLGPLSRKNGWQISGHAGEASPWGQQHLRPRRNHELQGPDQTTTEGLVPQPWIVILGVSVLERVRPPSDPVCDDWQ